MKLLIHPQIEAVLADTILPDLEKGRKDFDLPHTKAVVFWMKKLLASIPNMNVDPQVLITAAYAHDWGYIGLFDGVEYRSLEEINKRKPLHMERGARMIAALLTEKLATFFTQEQIARTAHLVSVHDLVEQLAAEDEKLLMEADTLGMLDATRVTPTFSPQDNKIFMQGQILGRRFPHFIHEEALKIGKELFEKRERVYKDLSSNI
jgi:hypothetical protein